MGKSVNRVTLVGNLGKDPEIVNSNSGTKIAKFSLATNESFKNKEGSWTERTEWHNIVVFARLADVVESYVKKGSQVYIEGKIQTRTYEKDGVTKYFTEIVGNELVLLGSKGSSSDISGDEPRAVAASRPVTKSDPIDDSDL